VSVPETSKKPSSLRSELVTSRRDLQPLRFGTKRPGLSFPMIAGRLPGYDCRDEYDVDLASSA